MSTDPETGAQRQRHIQLGREGDKVPGFDLSAAPMETDAEAGGSGSTAPEISPRDTEPASAHQSSFADAMRPVARRPARRKGILIWIWLIVVAVVLAALLFW